VTRTVSRLDRAAHRRGDAQWQSQAWPRSRVLVVEQGRVLVAGGRLVLLPPAAAPPGERLFLGLDAQDQPYFAVIAPLSAVDSTVLGQAVAGGRAVAGAGDVEADSGPQPTGVREILHRLPELEADLLMTAVALANWHARHRYAPGSGQSTSPRDAGWVRGDQAGEDLWPRTDPAVIVLVHDGDPGPGGRCLLGHNAAWTTGTSGVPRFSCLAGFVEPGESAEQAVVREVREEVGVQVSQLRYAGSQAWPYPGSLMLGFLATADPDAPLHLDPAEIAEARWFSRDEIRAAAAEDPAVGFGLSSPSSIAYSLIMTWLRGDVG
jgi:NAD+ diphosphatase